MTICASSVDIASELLVFSSLGLLIKVFLRNDLNLNMGHNHMHGNNVHSGMNMSTTPPMTHGDHGGHGSTVHHMMQVCIGCLVSFVYYFILKTASFQSEICHCSHF